MIGDSSYNDLLKTIRKNNRQLYKTSGTDLEVIERLYKDLEEAKELLDLAVCPCCDKSGAYYDGYGDVCQCQWCHEVSKL